MAFPFFLNKLLPLQSGKRYIASNIVGIRNYVHAEFSEFNDDPAPHNFLERCLI